MTADHSLLDDASTETLSTLEALNDIADTVETIVLGFSGEQERDAYLSRVDERRQRKPDTKTESVSYNVRIRRRPMVRGGEDEGDADRGPA